MKEAFSKGQWGRWGQQKGVTALGALVIYWPRGFLGVSCHLYYHGQKGEPGALGMGHALWIF